ncbi:hypothetical protein K438DRAFT_1938856 [Mycena galopus ATCC 62051]|nr:hypothetical protein K438DRAFT_1938856 [Mycena galopus ATCC 62051]
MVRPTAARRHHALDGVYHRGLWYCGHQLDAADGAGTRLGLVSVLAMVLASGRGRVVGACRKQLKLSYAWAGQSCGPLTHRPGFPSLSLLSHTNARLQPPTRPARPPRVPRRVALARDLDATRRQLWAWLLSGNHSSPRTRNADADAFFLQARLTLCRRAGICRAIRSRVSTTSAPRSTGGPTTFLNAVVKTHGWITKWRERRMYVNSRLLSTYWTKTSQSFWDRGDFSSVV